MPGAEQAAAGAAAAKAIPTFLPKFLHKYVGNPTMFRFLKPFEDKIPGLAWFNTAYSLAPTSKWALSIVPLYGVFNGNPPVQKIDLNTSLSLAFTGFVWTFYAMLITPQNTGSRMLAAVNFAMAAVNGYNANRKRVWLAEQARIEGGSK